MKNFQNLQEKTSDGMLPVNLIKFFEQLFHRTPMGGCL